MRSSSIVAVVVLMSILATPSVRADEALLKECFQVTGLANPVLDIPSVVKSASTTVSPVAKVTEGTAVCPHSCTDAVGCTSCPETCCDCGQCACSDCASPWRIQVGYINMSRNRPSGAVLIADPVGVPLFNAHQFDFSNQSGIDADLHKSLNQDWDLDARYLWINDFESSAAFAVPAGVNTIPTNPVTSLVGPLQANYSYRSAIQTAEINMRRNYGCWGLSSGFRFVDLDEEFAGFYTGGGFTNDTRWQTRNNLYGFQLGADAVLWQNCKGFRIDSFVKAGIYGNAASSSALIVSQLPGNTIISNSASDANHTAFLGELGLMGVYPLTEHLSLRAGYQLMWVSGVALASEQVAATGSLNPVGTIPSTIDTSGDLFYHGANVGLEIAW